MVLIAILYLFLIFFLLDLMKPGSNLGPILLVAVWQQKETVVQFLLQVLKIR